MAESDFSMTVFRRAGRKSFECQWVDPTTGKKKTRSTGAKTQKEADRFAGKLLDELRSGRFKERHLVTWDEFTERYTLEVVPSMANRTAGKVQGLFNAVKRLIDPKRLASVDAAQISRFQSSLRSEGLAEASIKSHLSHLRACLNWAKRVGMLDAVPSFTMPKRTATMKGRPITLEEFERIIGKVPAVVCAEIAENATESRRKAAEAVADRVAESWRHLLRGLWLSGLRLSEALNLHWTDERLISVDLSGRRPMLRIQPEGQKSGKLSLTPIAPDFAELLQSVPDDRRRGFVFNPLDERAGRRLSRVEVVSSVISAIGKAAGVKVSEKANR